MSIVKWSVSAWLGDPIRREYEKETLHFYCGRDHHGNVRRDAKVSRHESFFETESDALEFICQKKELRADMARIKQIQSCGVELLAALEGMMKCFDDGVGEHWNTEELDAARAAIAKAKGEA